MGSKEKRERTVSYAVFIIYVLFLIWLIMFKLADSVEKIPSMRGINLIPFYYDQFSNTRIHFAEVLQNALVFIPAGFYFTAFGKGKILTGVIASVSLSLCFETLQWFFALGASDITDLITNTAGGALGACLFLVSERLLKGRQMRIVNVIGIVLEAIFIALLVTLIALNR